MWTQSRTPKLDPAVYATVNGKWTLLTNWVGWCLAVVETAFGVPRAYPTATDAWNGAKKKHADDKFPTGVYFPIHFSSPIEPRGHIAIGYVNTSGAINIWTTPLKSKAYFDTFTSLSAIMRSYRLELRGWSEDLSGVDIITWVPDKPKLPYTVESIEPTLVASPSARNKWNLLATTWSEFVSQGTLTPNTPITAVAIAKHKLGGSYYMEDVTEPYGYNTVDLLPYIAPVQSPDVPIDTDQPEAETNTEPPHTPQVDNGFDWKSLIGAVVAAIGAVIAAVYAWVTGN